MSKEEKPTTVFEYNQEMITSLPFYDWEENPDLYAKSIEQIVNFVNKTPLATHFMLLNKYKGYITIYQKTKDYNPTTLAMSLLNLVEEDLGRIKLIQSIDNGKGLEFWTQGATEEKAQLYVFFDYSLGVVYI